MENSENNVPKPKRYNVYMETEKRVSELKESDINKIFGYDKESELISCRVVSFDEHKKQALVEFETVYNGNWTFDVSKDLLPKKTVEYSELCYASVVEQN